MELGYVHANLIYYDQMPKYSGLYATVLQQWTIKTGQHKSIDTFMG